MTDPAGLPVGIPAEVKDRLLAATDFIGRTGAASFKLQYCDEQTPLLWMAVASFHLAADPRSGDPRKRVGRTAYRVAAELDPLTATLRLCEELADGGLCTHCGRAAGLDPYSIETMPLDAVICWYLYDPELKTFRRGCEGDT